MQLKKRRMLNYLLQMIGRFSKEWLKYFWRNRKLAMRSETNGKNSKKEKIDLGLNQLELNY